MKLHARIVETVNPKKGDAIPSIIIQFVDDKENQILKFFVMILIRIASVLKNGIFGNFQLNGKAKYLPTRKLKLNPILPT